MALTSIYHSVKTAGLAALRHGILPFKQFFNLVTHFNWDPDDYSDPVLAI